MTNVTRGEYSAVYEDKVGLPGEKLTLMPDFPNSDKVALCIIGSSSGEAGTVVLGVQEEDLRALLYEMAVQSKLIKAGETLTLEGK